MFDSTGRVVFVGTLAATAVSPFWSCSRVIVNFIRSSIRSCLRVAT
jgi:hypothetical protein